MLPFFVIMNYYQITSGYTGFTLVSKQRNAWAWVILSALSIVLLLALNVCVIYFETNYSLNVMQFDLNIN